MKLVALVVSVAAFVVAALQFILAREKFKLDLFEKRLAIFKAVETFLNDAINDHEFTTENLIKFDKGTQTASFIFGDDIVNFISDIRTKGNNLLTTSSLLKNPSLDNDKHSDYVKKKHAIHQEFIDLNRTLKDKFSLYLKLKNWQSPFMWE